MADTNLVARLILRFQDEASRGLGAAQERVSDIGNEIDKVKKLAVGFLGFEAIKSGIENVIELSDKFAGLTGKIRQTIGAVGNLSDTQEKLINIALRTNAPLAGTVQLFSRASEALKKYTDSQELSSKLTETVNLSFKAQASSAAEINSTITQLTQSIATDAVQWEDFGQLADTNLMLVNVAAKNLGYDGLGSLKQAMADGKVANTQLVTAIVEGFDEIKAAADQMPTSVAGAWRNLETQFLRFIGKSGEAKDATLNVADTVNEAKARIVNAIDYMGDHIGELIAVSIQLGETLLAAFAASKLKALVLYAERLLAARAAAAALAAEQAAAGVAAGAAAVPVNLFAKAITGINFAVAALVAWQIGQTVGKWAVHFEWVQYVGANVAAMTAKFVAFGDFMTRPLSLESWRAFRAELGAIDVHFDGVRARIGQADSVYAESAQKITATEQEKTQAIETASLKQQTAFKAVQESVKALTAIIDSDTKMQTAAIEQGLAERLAAIDAMIISETQKDTQRVTAKLQAASTELQIQQQAGAAKLALIDQEYQAELAGAATSAARTRDIETQKRQDKLAVYSGLAEYYQGEVNRLSGVYASEFQAAQQAKQQLEALNQSHEMALFNIKLMGMTDREKIDAEASLFNDKIWAIQDERAKGEQADQEKINALMGEARGLHEKITAAAGTGSDELSRAKSRENKLWEEEKITLENNAADHEKNAARAKAAQASVAEQLQTTQAAISDITSKLNTEYALKIGLDSASLTAAQSAIADLTKPETKTITIETVNAGGDAPAAQASGDAPVAQATGGPAGHPTGTPWRYATGRTVGDLIRRFNNGGHTPMSGQLPGFGGGDKIKALLEPGEFIVRKEAVKKAGIPFLEHLNQFGEAPTGDVIRRATGGLVDAAKMRRDSALAARAAERKAARDNAADVLLNLAKSTSNLSSRDISNMDAIASGGADRWDKTIWQQLTTQANVVMKSSGMPGDALGILRAAADDYQAHGAGATLSRAKEMIRVMIENQTIADMQAQARRSPTLPALGDSGSSSSGLPALGGIKPFADIAAKLQAQSKSISLPMPSIPSVPSARASSAAQGNTTKIQFVSPKGESASGYFGESDATAILRVLKDAGARTA